MPKIVDVEEMKHLIMTEAVHVFTRRGYYNTTLAEIANRCGIGRTTIYQYFKNKEEIFIYAVEHVNQVFETEYKSILENSELGFLEKIKQILSQFILCCCRKNNEITMLIELWLIIKRENHELMVQVKKTFGLQKVFYQLLEEGARVNEIKPLHNMESLAFTLDALMESLMLYLPFTEPDEMVRHLNNLNLIIDGLKA